MTQPTETPPPPQKDEFHTGAAMIFGGFLTVVALGLLLLLMNVEWTWEYWGGTNADKSGVLRNVILIIGGPLTLGFLGWRSFSAHRQANYANDQRRISISGLQVDRYQKGAQLLESGEMALRVAGVLTLRELVRTDRDDTLAMVRPLLASFLRAPTPPFQDRIRPLVEVEPEYIYRRKLEQEADILEALEALAASTEDDEVFARKTPLPAINLREAFLPQINLRNANICRWDFTGSTLPLSSFFQALAAHARFVKADLERANFMKAMLFGADFSRADLRSALFYGADVSSAHLQARYWDGWYIGDSWAWIDQIPMMPDGVEYPGILYAPGPSNRHREEHYLARTRGYPKHATRVRDGISSHHALP
ncbi:pentapeptide repeat-containing protein [Breoghania corrubedonensis]|uniref:pentapeptide repeat-containing protein n=1 Tax=Breoghania corrubedonensis TaxID=665038 RepID=UPI000D37CD2F|nr:pentapeptide repeat-containing protein [Breoghania corrubedonensis]